MVDLAREIAGVVVVQPVGVVERLAGGVDALAEGLQVFLGRERAGGAHPAAPARGAVIELSAITDRSLPHEVAARR